MADRTVVVYLKANDQLTPAFQKASSAAKSLGKEVTSGTDQARKGIAGLGISAKQIAGGLGFAGIAVGVGKMAVSFVSFGSAMSGVSAATMATAGDLDRLREAALAAGQGTQYSATEAAQGITELAKAGVSTADIMGGGLAGALSLAAAGQLEVASAAQISATALSIFGLKGSEMSHVADLLAAGAGKAQGSVNDLSMALNQSALVAKNTGLSIEDTTGALALFASKGLLGSDAGTSFKTMLMSLNPRSAEAASLMDELGLHAYDASGKFVGLSAYAQQLKDSLSGLSQEQRNAALQTIFGTDAVRAATILYEAGAAGVEEWANNVNDSGYAAEQAARLTDNLAGDLDRLKGALENAFISGGGKADESLRKLVQQITTMVPELAKAITSLFQIGSAFVSVAGLGLTAFAPLLSILGSVAELVGQLPAPVQAAALAFLLFANNKNAVVGFFTGIGDAFRGFREEMALQAALGAGVSGSYRQLGDEAHNSGKKISTFSAATATARARISALGKTIGSAIGPMALTAGLGLLVGAIVGAAAEGQALTASLRSMGSAMATAGFDAQVLNKALRDAGDNAGGFFNAIPDDFAKANVFDRAAEGIISLGKDSEFSAHQMEMLTGKQRELAKALEAGDFDRARRILEDMSTTAEGYAEAASEAGAGADEAAAATDTFGQAAADAKEQVDSYKQSLEDLKSYYNDLGDLNADLITSEIAASKAIADTQTMIAEGGGTYDEVRTQLVGLRDDLLGQVDAWVAAGKAKTETDALFAQGKQTFLDLATQLLGDAAAAQLLADQLFDIPEATPITVDFMNYTTTGDQLRLVLAQLQGMPPNTPVKVEGITAEAMQRLTDLGYTVRTLPDGTVEVSAPNVGQVEQTLANLSRTRYATISVQAVMTGGGAGSNKGSVGYSVIEADGGYVAFAKGGYQSFAKGGENHIAQFAPAGTKRMWAEAETDGEWYVPRSDSKRSRSKVIVEDIIDKFGGQVSWSPERSIPPAMAAAGSISRSTRATVAALQEQVTVINAVLELDGQVVYRNQQLVKRDRDRRGGPS